MNLKEALGEEGVDWGDESDASVRVRAKKEQDRMDRIKGHDPMEIVEVLQDLVNRLKDSASKGNLGTSYMNYMRQLRTGRLIQVDFRPDGQDGKIDHITINIDEHEA